MKTKKLTVTILVFILFCSCVLVFAQEKSVSVYVDGQQTVFDVSPEIKNGRTLVPLRGVFEALGADVRYVSETNSVFARKRGKIASLTVGDNKMYVNGIETALDVPAEIKNDRVMIPLRAVSETLDAKVFWDSDTYSVYIESKQGDHYITDKYFISEFKADDGTVLFNGYTAYPEIKNDFGNSVIEKLNSQFKEEAEKYVNNSESEFRETSLYDYNNNFENRDYEFRPYEFSRDFDITYDKDGLLSINTTYYTDTHGAHPSSYMLSELYNTETGKKLEIFDLISESKEIVTEKIKEAFYELIDSEPKCFFEGAKETVNEKAESISFYLTEEGIALYFNAYDIAPYSTGRPTVFLTLEKQDSGFKFSDKKYFADELNSYIQTDENYMISPFSIKTALMMLANGAEGTSKDEILNVLNVSDCDEFNNEIQKAIKLYSANENLTFNIANSIWLNTDNTNQSFNDNYKKILEEFYGAAAEQVTNSDAVSKINGWIKEKTQGKIDGITNSSDFSAYLANAVYFKADWLNPFNKDLAEKKDFTDINNKKSSIDFMNTLTRMNYYEDADFKIAELPYKGGNMSMYVIMGNSRIKNPQKVLEEHNLKSVKVNLSIPKFKTEFSVNLADILKKMGIKKVFTDNSGLEKIFDQGTATVTEVAHKTYIDVNEEGTEAAAATGIGLTATSLNPETIYDFTVDKPFTYIIKDKSTNDIIFMGQINIAP